MAFQKGNKHGKGGAKPGAGRPSNEFRELCAQALDEVKGIDFVKAVVAGVKFESPFGKSEAKPETRLEAVKWLADRAHGKAMQAVELSGADGEPLSFEVVSYAKNKNP